MPPNFVTSRNLVHQNLPLPRPPLNRTHTPKRSRPNSVHSREARLSIIEEDGDTPRLPPMPIKAHHRPFHRRWNIGDPPRHSYETSPPKYSVWDTTGPKGEKLADVRNNKYIARRGGWRRIFLIAFLVIGSIIGLVVGLVFGLRKNHSKPASDSSTNSTARPSPSTAGPFPAGSWTLTTYLDTVQTDCSSTPNSWSCYPYTTFNQSHTSSLANFTWVIQPTFGGFSISSTNSPLSLNFTETPLTKMDAGSDEERFVFSAAGLEQTTYPDIGVQCYFNDTTLQGELYTKKPRTYPQGATSTPPDSGQAFNVWPYAVTATQTTTGGADVPECYHMTATGARGDRITDGYAPKSANDVCGCRYKNFDS